MVDQPAAEPTDQELWDEIAAAENAASDDSLDLDATIDPLESEPEPGATAPESEKPGTAALEPAPVTAAEEKPDIWVNATDEQKAAYEAANEATAGHREQWHRRNAENDRLKAENDELRAGRGLPLAEQTDEEAKAAKAEWTAHTEE